MEFINHVPRAKAGPIVLYRTRDMVKDDRTITYFPKTTWHPAQFHLITTSSPATDAEHLVGTSTFEKGTDMEAVKAGMKPAYFYIKTEWDMDNRICRMYYNANASWNLTDWTSPQGVWPVVWETIQGTVLEGELDLICQAVDLNNQQTWKSLVRPLRSGQSLTIDRPGNDCYFISHYARLTIGEKSHRQERYINLSSEAVNITAEGDTLLTMFYRE